MSRACLSVWPHRNGVFLVQHSSAGCLVCRGRYIRQQCRFFRQDRRNSKQEELFPQRMELPENRGYVPMLSPKQVSAVLTEYQMTHATSGINAVRAFDTNFLASNNPIEDRRAVGWLPQTGGNLFAVYDGHGGSACAQSVSERLFDYIAVSMMPPVVLEEYFHTMRTDDPLPIMTPFSFRSTYRSDDLCHIYAQDLQRFVTETLSFGSDDFSGSSSGGSMADMLSAAFVRLDTDICHEAMPVGGAVDMDLVEIAKSGCCACVAHVGGTRVDVANVGDCRAVIGRLTPGGGWRAIPLSIDHNVDNEDEVRRIVSQHPDENGTLIRNDRLLGQLIPLRCFGDIRFKWPASDLRKLAGIIGIQNSQMFVPQYYRSPPYVTAEPDVIHHDLTTDDRFMVIASDGLWETMSNETAIEIIGDHMLGKETRNLSLAASSFGSMTLGEIAYILGERHRGKAHRSTDDNGATHLLRHALGYDHPKVSEMLTFPPAIARHFRDDITIMIVYFNMDFLSTNCPN